jgi:ferritin-like metal-binding protein YciE
LRKLDKVASSPELRKAFASHLDETRGQLSRLEKVFSAFDEKARGSDCEGLSGIIAEAKSIIDDSFDKPTMDACLIAVVQRMAHYEMATYGTLAVWARALGNDDAADLLDETLEEERATDELLSTIAMRDVNDDAADTDDSDTADDEADSDGSDKTGRAKPPKRRGVKARAARQKARRR